MMIMKMRSYTMREAETSIVFHRDFLGAHRYTTFGGICAPCGAYLAAMQPRGGATLPLRRAGHAYPLVYFACGESLKSRASPPTKSNGAIPSVSCAPQRQKVG